MRDRADQGAPQTVDFVEQLGAHGLLAQLGPLQGQGQMVGECSQQFVVRLDTGEPPEGQQADGVIRGGERHGLQVAGRHDRGFQAHRGRGIRRQLLQLGWRKRGAG